MYHAKYPEAARRHGYYTPSGAFMGFDSKDNEDVEQVFVFALIDIINDISDLQIDDVSFWSRPDPPWRQCWTPRLMCPLEVLRPSLFNRGFPCTKIQIILFLKLYCFQELVRLISLQSRCPIG